MASLARDGEVERDTRESVEAILASVRRDGYPAVYRFTEAFDRVQVPETELRLPEASLAKALTKLRREESALIQALEGMIEGIRRFAEAQRVPLGEINVALPGGGTASERWVPLRSAGVYIPGGRAFYPSTLAMTVIPAQVAGVERIVGVTPPRPEGPDDLVLATAALLGLEELLLCGGAQGVAWLAYGEAVDLIAGPGNRFVAEAKRQLLGTCGIDAIAGPTEVLILADASADPAWLAEDLMAQAEHDPDAAAVLISENQDLLDAVARELQTRVALSPRREVLEQSLNRHGRLFCMSKALAIAFAQAWAPEHLELAVADPENWADQLSTAGALFLGHATAEAFGDYGVGPNHVLPTNRSARFTSPLGVATFMKRQTRLALTEATAAYFAPGVMRLAEAEGLVHHAGSAQLRAHHR